MVSKLSIRKLLILLIAASLLACVCACGPKLGLLRGSTPEDFAKIKAEIGRLEQKNDEPETLLMYYNSAAHQALALANHKEAIALSGKGLKLVDMIEKNENRQGDIYFQGYKDRYRRVYGSDQYINAAKRNLVTYEGSMNAVLYQAYTARGDKEKAKIYWDAMNAVHQEMNQQIMAGAKPPPGSSKQEQEAYQRALQQRNAAMEESRKVQERTRECTEKLNEALENAAATPDKNAKERLADDFLASPCGEHYRKMWAMRYGYGMAGARTGQGLAAIDPIANDLVPDWLYASFGLRDKTKEALRHNFPILKKLNERRIEEINEIYKAEFGISLGHLLMAVIQNSQRNQMVVASLSRIFGDYADMLNRCMEYDEVDLAGELLTEINTLATRYEKVLASYEKEIKPYNAINMGALARTYAQLPDVELENITKILEREIVSLESKRAHMPSQADRIGLIKKSQEMLQSMVLREYRRGNYEKALELALRSKSRTMVDLFLSSESVTVESGGSAGPVFTVARADATGGKRSITIKPAAKKAGGAFDLDLESAAGLPGISELCRNIPPDTAFLETLTTMDGLYLWLLTDKGLAGEARIPISPYELGEKVWQARTMLTLGGQAARQAGKLDLSFKLKAAEGMQSLNAVEIYLTNGTNRPVSPLYGTCQKAGMAGASTLKIETPFIMPGETKKIASFDLLGSSYTISLGTDIGELKGGMTVAGKDRVVWESYATVRGRKYQGVALADLIFKPFEGQLGSVRHLVVSPHGVLNYLPFDLLKIKGHYVCENWAISTLPSAVMVALMPAGKTVRTESVLILGNPDTDIPDLASLPGAERESREIAAILGGDSTVAVGREATETLLKQMAPQAGIIHIASHGIFLPSDPMQSFLAVSGDGLNDGRFTVAEIFDLKLSQAPIVVLSACKTGLNNLHQGNELFGFMRAFLYSGAYYLITSLWDVDDEATRFLMTSFYRHLQAGAAPVTAFQQAKIDAIRSSKYSAPGKWGAFIIVGM